MSNDLIARLRQMADGLHDDMSTGAEAAAEMAVVVEQRNSLRAALTKVLDTRSKEAKTAESYRNIAENCSDSAYAAKAHERAMFAAIDAEQEARILLLTLKDVPSTVNYRIQDN